MIPRSCKSPMNVRKSSTVALVGSISAAASALSSFETSVTYASRVLSLYPRSTVRYDPYLPSILSISMVGSGVIMSLVRQA